ncbi:MAG: HEAT repeat domain-containing protein [Desulfobacterales bacterium]|nr:HEAT repeat domain-containing protein [Desulfobacterales bacterium]
MDAGKALNLDTLSETELEPVLSLLQGGDPDVIAETSGIAKDRLFRIRDDLLAQVAKERPGPTEHSRKKIGRNDPCACGSGKKYKHCCLNREKSNRDSGQPSKGLTVPASAKEQARLIHDIEQAFSLLHTGRYTDAIGRAVELLRRYPNEDRLHDIRATALLYAGHYESAIRICRSRLAEAEREKTYFIEHGRYRDAKIDQPTLAYIYPPMTWLQKTWIAVKAEAYQDQVPADRDEKICKLISELESADDESRFPAKEMQGLELRRKKLEQTLKSLKSIGPDVTGYLLPVSVKYGWAGLFVPEILSAYRTASAARGLIDISMFGFAYASGASLHYLERWGAAVVAHIEDALSRDKEFDPIKTGIVSVLGNIQSPAAYEILIGLLEHEDPHIVNWAGDAIARHGNADALAALTEARDRIGGERMIDQAIFRLQDLLSGVSV